MTNLVYLTSAFLATCLFASTVVFAQPPGKGVGQGGRGQMQGADPEALTKMLMQRFDKDGDQKLDQIELTAAVEAMRLMGGMAGGFGGGRPGMAGGAGGPGMAGGVGGAGRPMGGVQMFKQFDANSDGKLTGDEVPERMRRGMARIDTNADGAIELSEIEQMTRSFGGGGRPARDPAAAEGNRKPNRPDAE